MLVVGLICQSTESPLPGEKDVTLPVKENRDGGDKTFLLSTWSTLLFVLFVYFFIDIYCGYVMVKYRFETGDGQAVGI